jgi:RNA ligase (TIGR02306 family)
MSTFDCAVTPITIIPHPNAEKLELAQVADYRCVVGKDLYKTGDLVAYIPEAAVIPEDQLQFFGYWSEANGKGLLAGSKGDRVKAVKLRGEVSQGLVFPVEKIKMYLGQLDREFNVGDDVAGLLGIVKYEPPIPVGMAGEVYNCGQSVTVDYDIENLKKYPDVLVEGEEVIFTEKLHGTSFQIGLLPIMDKYHNDAHFRVKTEDGEAYFFIGSKGLGAQGLCFKDNGANTNNVYVRAARQFKLFEKLLKLRRDIDNGEFDPLARETRFEGNTFVGMIEPLILQGEVFGAVQDLTYGAKQGEIFFRAFDICVGERSYRRYFDEEKFAKAIEIMEIDRCPVLYKGPYSKEKILELTHHTKSVVCPTQISEGGVVKPTKERKDPAIPTMGGRVILKSINEDYLLRKGNATEFN